MITIYEYPLQMIVPEERHQNGYDNLGQDKHIVYIMSQQSVHPVHPVSHSVRANVPHVFNKILPPQTKRYFSATCVFLQSSA